MSFHEIEKEMKYLVDVRPIEYQQQRMKELIDEYDDQRKIDRVNR